MKWKLFCVSFAIIGTTCCLAEWKDSLHKTRRDAKTDKSVNDVIGIMEKLKTWKFVSRLRRTGLASTLTSKGPFTVFAPTDTAFSSVSTDYNTDIDKNVTSLTDNMEFHIVAQPMAARLLKNDMMVRTLSGTNLRINVYREGRVITVNGCRVTLPDQYGSNGIVHVIDQVMIEADSTIAEKVLNMDGYTTAVDALYTAGVMDILNGTTPYTLFVPDDAAFRDLPEGVMSYLFQNPTLLRAILYHHCLKGTYWSPSFSDGVSMSSIHGEPLTLTQVGGEFKVDGASISTHDIRANNGVIHMIDQVLLPPSIGG